MELDVIEFALNTCKYEVNKRIMLAKEKKIYGPIMDLLLKNKNPTWMHVEIYVIICYMVFPVQERPNIFLKSFVKLLSKRYTGPQITELAKNYNIDL